MSLTQKPVRCDCPAEFVFNILDTLPGGIEMAACKLVMGEFGNTEDSELVW